jgi:hypothetical protein
MRNKSKLFSEGCDSGSNKRKQGYGVTYSVAWLSLHLHLAGVWSQAVGFMSVRLA